MLHFFEGIQSAALVAGVLVIGLVLWAGAVVQLVKGETWGATGKGRVSRTASPAYFWYIFIVRLFLGIGMTVISLIALL